MAFPVVSGATLQCSMGMMPSAMQVIPSGVTSSNQPMATIMDNKPFVNIMPFGLCNSLANPITASQTAAALGVLTPGTCTPVIPAPWMPGSSTVLVGNLPALNDTSTCVCAYGGVVQVSVSPATTAQVP